MCRYHLNLKEQCIVDGKTGEIMKPSCWHDLAALHSYMQGIGRSEQAEEMLKDVFKGEKVISKMIAKYQERTGSYTAFSGNVSTGKSGKNKKSNKGK